MDSEKNILDSISEYKPEKSKGRKEFEKFLTGVLVALCTITLFDQIITDLSTVTKVILGSFPAMYFHYVYDKKDNLKEQLILFVSTTILSAVLISGLKSKNTELEIKESIKQEEVLNIENAQISCMEGSYYENGVCHINKKESIFEKEAREVDIEAALKEIASTAGYELIFKGNEPPQKRIVFKLDKELDLSKQVAKIINNNRDYLSHARYYVTDRKSVV